MPFFKHIAGGLFLEKAVLLIVLAAAVASASFFNYPVGEVWRWATGIIFVYVAFVAFALLPKGWDAAAAIGVIVLGVGTTYVTPVPAAVLHKEWVRAVQRPWAAILIVIVEVLVEEAGFAIICPTSRIPDAAAVLGRGTDGVLDGPDEQVLLDPLVAAYLVNDPFQFQIHERC